MRIATLQFSPSLGAVDQNIRHANSLIETSKHGTLDVLVLPEMAFSGYNFPNLEAIKPFLEPTASGPTTEWAIATAKQLSCHVIVGYPEIATAADGTTSNYNSTVTISPTGQVLHNYRKSFLYYTDETWAKEGFSASIDPANRMVKNFDEAFHCGPLGDLNAGHNIGLGICMDINPYRFEAPWDAFEFATTMLKGRAHLVILSMAWLTRLLPADLEIEPYQPDMETVAYWLDRFYPLSQPPKLGEPVEPTIVVFANRCGMEGNRTGLMRIENGEEVQGGDRACYAGSSCVMRFQGGNVRLYEKGRGEVAILGKAEEGLLVVDTAQPARFLLTQSNF